jgi:hypothetical protein
MGLAEDFFKDSSQDYFTIHFNLNDDSVSWCYGFKKDMEQEYDWILSQLDCRVNDGNKGLKCGDDLYCNISPCIHHTSDIDKCKCRCRWDKTIIDCPVIK